MTHRMEDGPRVVRAVLEAKARFIDSGVIGQVKLVGT